MKKRTFKITCYGRTTEYPESKRKEMMDFYLQGARECDGCEAERYSNIFFDLYQGLNDCTDEH